MCDQHNAPRYFEFEADGPKCPRCGFEGPPAIQQLAKIHYHAKSDSGPHLSSEGRYELACKPMRPNLINLCATGVVSVVTCKACIETDVYKRDKAIYDETMGDDD